MSTERIWTPKEIRERYSQGERDFRGVEIADPDPPGSSFRNAVLEGADFTGAFIVADFSDSNLRRCRFVQANVKTCSFNGTDLFESDFSSASIDGATFVNARVERAKFTGAGWYGKKLEQGQIPDTAESES